MIEHPVQFWHIELSRDGGGEWGPVATELPPETLSYAWTVPDIECADCTLRVTMDNPGTDYDDAIGLTIGAPDGADPGTDMDAGLSDMGPDLGPPDPEDLGIDHDHDPSDAVSPDTTDGQDDSADPPPTTDDAGCGCGAATGSSPPLGALLGLLLVIGPVRKRAAGSAQE